MPAVLRSDPDKGIDPEKDILAAKFEIEYEDVFHLKNLYKRMYEWLVAEGWISADGDDENYETLYWERTNASEMKEHQIWWRAYQIPRGNRYYRYFLKIDIQTLTMKKSEVLVRGQKLGSNKGDIIIRVESYLQLDYPGEWKKSGFLRMMDRIFRKRIYSGEIQKYKKDLYATTYRLHTTIKQYLQLKPTVADWGRPFHPEKGA